MKDSDLFKTLSSTYDGAISQIQLAGKMGSLLSEKSSIADVWWGYQELIQGVLDIGIPILGTLTWARPNLILSKTEATIKSNSRFLIKSGT